MLSLRFTSLAAATIASVACAAVHEPTSHTPEQGAASAPVAPSSGPSSDGSTDDASASEATSVAVPVEGTDLVRGKSTVSVAATIDRVREVVLDFGHYPEFMPHYTNCKVLGRKPGGARDVYMEVEALHGAVKLWARVEMSKQVAADGVETYASKFVEGNVKDFHAVWQLKKIDDGHTQLSLEVFLYPNLPMPSRLMNEQNMEKSALGVLAMRTRAESGGPK